MVLHPLRDTGFNRGFSGEVRGSMDEGVRVETSKWYREYWLKVYFVRVPPFCRPGPGTLVVCLLDLNLGPECVNW